MNNRNNDITSQIDSVINKHKEAVKIQPIGDDIKTKIYTLLESFQALALSTYKSLNEGPSIGANSNHLQHSIETLTNSFESVISRVRRTDSHNKTLQDELYKVYGVMDELEKVVKHHFGVQSENTQTNTSQTVAASSPVVSARPRRQGHDAPLPDGRARATTNLPSAGLSQNEDYNPAAGKLKERPAAPSIAVKPDAEKPSATSARSGWKAGMFSSSPETPASASPKSKKSNLGVDDINYSQGEPLDKKAPSKPASSEPIIYNRPRR